MKTSIKCDLLTTDPLRKSILAEMINTLQLPRGSHGLDAGCGIGLQCLALIEEVGETGRVVGVDLSSELLDQGRQLVRDAGLADRVSLQKEDLANLSFANNSFDWVWSCDCVGYGSKEPLLILKELARVVKPGGLIAISSWSSENLLPGYSGLEARLKNTSVGIAPFKEEMQSEAHFLRALSWFKQLEMQKIGGKTFAQSFYAPLSQKIREGLQRLIEMRWPDAEAELSAEDMTIFRKLCRPDSPDYILNLSDYYAFFTYTLFWGRVAL